MNNREVLQSLCKQFDPDLDLEQNVLKNLSKRKNLNKRVAFFCPKSAFAANFGLIPYYLERNYCEVIWLYGTANDFLNSKNKNKYLIINDMISQIYGIDAIITASVMDCIPKGIKKILIDHISFAPFDLENKIKLMLEGKLNLPTSYKSKNEFFEKYSAFIAFTPFYDLILTSSNSTHSLTCNSLLLSGYGNKEKLEKSKILDKKSISDFVNLDNYRNHIQVSKVGYPKLDNIQNQKFDSSFQNIIVYAPTPNDETGNKTSSLWSKGITINDYGADLLFELCKSFPDYKIVFKPYKLEKPDVVKNICQKNKKNKNFSLDQSGSDYWELYSRTKILISDTSSTAFTFSLGLQRPVIFFSPNENKIDTSILEGSYMKNRSNVGGVAKSIDEVIELVRIMNDDYKFYLNKAIKFANKNFINPGESSKFAAYEILGILKSKRFILKSIFLRKKFKVIREFFRKK